MSTWTSFVGGMFQEKPGTQELAERSSKRAPRAINTSQCRPAWFAAQVPLRPMKPRLSACSMSSVPIPLGDMTTGMPSRSVKDVSSTEASDRVTPWPINSSGRFAFCKRSATSVTAWGAAPDRRKR